MHLIIDGYSNDPELLRDERFLSSLLDTYPTEIGMTKITQPMVIRYKGSNPQDWGISGFVFIAESHISVHTFVETRYINIDVFSCKAFDTARVVNDMKEKFRLVEWRVHRVERDWEPGKAPVAARASRK